MANEEQLNILKQGVETWNKWRQQNPQIEVDLSRANLNGADLSSVNLSWATLTGVYLRGATLRSAKLTKADLRWAELGRAYLREATLTGADLSGANLREADLTGANLSGADLSWAILSWATLSRADLNGADLSEASLNNADFTQATLAGCSIFGISAWGVKLDGAIQSDLVITNFSEPTVTVDSLEVAQFIYLLLHNEKIRDVINTIGQKAVLILGRFTPERKAVLDVIKNLLREKGYLPILFDFEKSEQRDFTETLKIIAGMCLFIIADITDPKSSPLELQATVPEYMIPFVPIIQANQEPFSMFVDLQQKYRWVLPVCKYNDIADLRNNFERGIINPALRKHNELIEAKSEKLKILNIGE